MKKLLIIFTFMLCGSCQVAYAQETEPKVEITQATAEKAADCFVKSKAKDELIVSLEAELVTNKDLRAKEEIYNAELLKAVALLTSSEKRNKGFFEKLRVQLGKVLTAVTDPKQLAAVVSIILILDRLKK